MNDEELLSICSQMIRNKEFDETTLEVISYGILKAIEEEQELSEMSEISMSDSIQFNSLTQDEKARVEYETKVYSRDRMELEWLKLHAYIGLNNREEYNRIIKKIISEDGVHQTDAKKLYESLK